ncbi:MAG: Crp/Fnr family transcriptional regulator [Aestuariivirga sp.]
MKQPTKNNLLDHLRSGDFDLLAPHLKPFSANANEILYDHGQDVSTVYFPLGPTLVSFVISTEDGGAVETMLIGREGAVGGIVSQGKLPAYSKIMVQFGGDFMALPITVLDQAKTASRSLDNLFARYADCTMAQIFQSTACNAAHGIEQRAAKWILAAVDRTGESEVPLTQERLAAMLGVGRSYISRVIGRFKQEKILSVKRGYLVIEDHHRLAQKSCGCNDAVRGHFETVLKGDYPDESDGNG